MLVRWGDETVIAAYALACILSLYAFWKVARDEGFIGSHIFDFYFFVLFGVVLGAWKFGLEGAVALGLIFAFVFSRLKGWSLKKIGDVITIPAILAISALSISRFLNSAPEKQGENFILTGLVLLGLAFALYLRRVKFFGRSSKVFRMNRMSKLAVSGGLFYIFLLLGSALGIIFLARTSVRILFYSFLMVYVLSSLYFDVRKDKAAQKAMVEFLKNARERLISKKRKLSNEKERLESEDLYDVPGRADDNAEDVDDAQEDIQHRGTEALVNAIKAALRQVEKALNHIKSGKYGICEKCGNPIDPARLKAYPETTLCLKCSSRANTR